ncbi:hypothetical protein ACLKA7_002608 [Drosophila subpalustris]
MRLTAFLLAIACALAYFGDVRAACCRASLTLGYHVEGGTCADAGGHSGPHVCTITICADVGHVAKSFGPCFAGGLTIGIVRDTVQEQHYSNNNNNLGILLRRAKLNLLASCCRAKEQRIKNKIEMCFHHEEF